MTTKQPSEGPAPKKKKPAMPRPHAAARPDEMPDDVVEFITAIDEYKRQHGRPFPNWSEVLEVVKGLGYAKT